MKFKAFYQGSSAYSVRSSTDHPSRAPPFAGSGACVVAAKNVCQLPGVELSAISKATTAAAVPFPRVPSAIAVL